MNVPAVLGLLASLDSGALLELLEGGPGGSEGGSASDGAGAPVSLESVPSGGR